MPAANYLANKTFVLFFFSQLLICRPPISQRMRGYDRL